MEDTKYGMGPTKCTAPTIQKSEASTNKVVLGAALSCEFMPLKQC